MKLVACAIAFIGSVHNKTMEISTNQSYHFYDQADQCEFLKGKFFVHHRFGNDFRIGI